MSFADKLMEAAFPSLCEVILEQAARRPHDFPGVVEVVGMEGLAKLAADRGYECSQTLASLESKPSS